MSFREPELICLVQFWELGTQTRMMNANKEPPLELDYYMPAVFGRNQGCGLTPEMVTSLFQFATCPRCLEEYRAEMRLRQLWIPSP